MEKKIAIVENFFDMCDIQLNPNKSELIVIGNKRDTHISREIMLNNILIKANKKDKATRYLDI